MKTVPTSSLAPGSFIDQQVFLDKGYILLTPDSPVTPELVGRLQKWKYAEVFTEGKTREAPADGVSVAAQVPTAKTIDQNIEDAKLAESARTFHQNLSGFTAALLAKYIADGVIPLAEVTEWIKKTIRIVHDARDFILLCLDSEADADHFLVSHAVNSTILSVAIGDFLKAPPHRLIELGQSGLLHEIGMFRLPAELRRSKSAYSPEERKVMSAHTVAGYRVLKGVSAPENVALAALEHHERMDGSGYPRSLTADKITEYARIVAVTCSYDAMVSRRPFREGVRDGHSAIKELLQTSRKQYDDRILKAIVYTLSIYPVGTAVLLSNNQRGVVVRTDSAKPRCPVVKVLADQDGRPVVEPQLVRVSENHGVSISRVLKPEEVGDLRQRA
ncbi:MAG TPA: HD domain-containing phosphohydrolase [Spirochaetia bacterium]|nr:HD domain-containing phosphohydrolase [Spirochaetia bacterium]